MTKNEILEQMDVTLELFRVQHEKTTKTGISQARKLVVELRNLAETYRKTSIKEGKQ